jgi:iron complex transport system substrate-binding protein
MSTPDRPRRGPLVLAALLVTGLLAACGGGATDDVPAAGGGGAFPVTVEHKYGSTEITREPRRIVTLGLSDHEIVLAFGSKPVGVVDWFKEKPFGNWPWQQPKWGGTEPQIVGERDEYNLEKVAALEPDLVIAQYSGMKKEQYDTLSQIAPVVAQPADFADYAAPWQEMTRLVGRSLGRSPQAEALIDGIADRFAEVREEHPEFAGQTIVVADNFQPGVYSAFAKHDPKMLFMTEIGFEAPDWIQNAPTDKNVVDVGSEGLARFDVDRVVWLTSSPQSDARVRADPVYRRLEVVRDERDLFVPYSAPPVGASISYNTVLSIPYAIDQMVPLLAQSAE